MPLVALVFLIVAGCSAPPEADAPPAATTAPTPVEGRPSAPDPLETTFKLQDSIASATDAEKFVDVNPFGYRNPLRSS